MHPAYVNAITHVDGLRQLYLLCDWSNVMLNILHYHLTAKDNTFYMYACFTYTTLYIYIRYSSRLLTGVGLSHVYVFSVYFYKSKAFER